MRQLTHILCIISVILSAAGCTGSGEDNPLRDKMEQVRSLGIWKDGSQIVPFSKSGDQYWCSPSERTIRIIDNEGAEYTELRLDRMPAEGIKVSGTLTGTMGTGTVEVKELYILRQDLRNIWLWSDVSGVGLVLPRYGIL